MQGLFSAIFSLGKYSKVKVILGTKKDPITKHFSRCLEIVQQFGICDTGVLSHKKIKIVAITSCIISLKYFSILTNGK